MAKKLPPLDRAKVITAICDQLADGIPLRAICRQEGMPAWRTVYDWIKGDAEIAAKFEGARLIGFDAIAEDILEIADTPKVGLIKTYEGESKTVREEDMLGHRKLQIETRLKLLAKWHPKKYGERVTHTGDPEAPVQLVLNGSDVHG